MNYIMLNSSNSSKEENLGQLRELLNHPETKSDSYILTSKILISIQLMYSFLLSIREDKNHYRNKTETRSYN